MVIFVAFTVGGLIGVFKGEEAKQKFVFKMKSKYDNKKMVAERKLIARNGGVLLDEIEMAAFHNN
jgi:dihydroneopterin aldolase